MLFGTDDDNERTLWVQAVYRATGQSHKPTPPLQQSNKISNSQISRMQGGSTEDHVVPLLLCVHANCLKKKSEEKINVKLTNSSWMQFRIYCRLLDFSLSNILGNIKSSIEIRKNAHFATNFLRRLWLVPTPASIFYSRKINWKYLKNLLSKV